MGPGGRPVAQPPVMPGGRQNPARAVRLTGPGGGRAGRRFVRQRHRTRLV